MKSLARVLRSFRYAGQGLRIAFATQLNFRVQCGVALVAVALGILLKISPSEWLWISVSIALVLAAELSNTALETLVNLVSPGFHEKAGQAKDLAAAAVTIMAVNAVITGAVIFAPRLWACL